MHTENRARNASREIFLVSSESKIKGPGPISYQEVNFIFKKDKSNMNIYSKMRIFSW